MWPSVNVMSSKGRVGREQDDAGLRRDGRDSQTEHVIVLSLKFLVCKRPRSSVLRIPQALFEFETCGGYYNQSYHHPDPARVSVSTQVHLKPLVMSGGRVEYGFARTRHA